MGDHSLIFRPDILVLSVERSLRRLNTDAIDIILVHSDGNDEDIITNFGTLEVLSDLKKKVKLRLLVCPAKH